jgi:hypothetical protein
MHFSGSKVSDEEMLRWSVGEAVICCFEAASGLMALGHVPNLYNLLYDACMARIPSFEIEFLA